MKSRFVKILGATAIVPLLLSLGACSQQSGGSDGEDRALTVGCYGGNYGDGIAQAVGERFTEETGAKVEYVQGNPSDLVAQVLAAPEGSSPLDVVCLDGSTQVDAINNDLLLPLDGSMPTEEVITDTFTPLNPNYSPGVGLWFAGVIYNTDEFKKAGLAPIEDWSDLWQPDLAGRLSFPDITVGSGVMFASSAGDMATGDLTDLEAGIDEIAKLDPYQIWTSSTDAQNDMAAGNIWATVLADGRSNQLIDDGLSAEFVVPKLSNGKRGLSDVVTIDAVKGAANEDLATEFRNIAHEADAQFDLYDLTGYSPSHPEATLSLIEANPDQAGRFVTPDDLKDYVAAPWNEVSDAVQDAVEYFRKV